MKTRAEDGMTSSTRDTVTASSSVGSTNRRSRTEAAGVFARAQTALAEVGHSLVRHVEVALDARP
jgi:hypothetical protein